MNPVQSPHASHSALPRQRLKSLRLRNYRCYADTHKIEFADINVFIGANNSGKSSLLSAIELFLLNTEMTRRPNRPLQFEDLASFASFDAIRRIHWTATAPQIKHVTASVDWDLVGLPAVGYSAEYTIERGDLSGIPEVTKLRLEARLSDASAICPAIEMRRMTGPGDMYRVTDATPSADFDESKYMVAMFQLGLPLLMASGSEGRRKELPIQSELLTPFYRHWPRSSFAVVQPSRPVPRSVYVLDDAKLDPGDRETLERLLAIWTSPDGDFSGAKHSIQESARKMGLANHIEVRRVRSSARPMLEVVVSTGSKRQKVTIADVGFGLSQALPLLTHVAQLRRGALVSYQPELHLHPFAQSRLADIFWDCANSANQVFIETHSEYLILRLQHLIASGEIPAHRVRVFCVEAQQKGTQTKNAVEGSRVYPMDFDALGKPSSAWPKGFLDTGLTLARELASSRRATH